MGTEFHEDGPETPKPKPKRSDATAHTFLVEDAPLRTVPTPFQQKRDRYRDRIEQLMVEGLNDAEIARQLTAEGWTTPKGRAPKRKNVNPYTLSVRLDWALAKKDAG